MKTWQTCPGRMAEVIATLPHPERCGCQSSGAFGEYVTIKEWPSRKALKETIKMQDQRASNSRDWHFVLRDCKTCMSRPHADYCPQKETPL